MSIFGRRERRRPENAERRRTFDDLRRQLETGQKLATEHALAVARAASDAAQTKTEELDGRLTLLRLQAEVLRRG